MRSFETGYLGNYIQDVCLNEQKTKVSFNLVKSLDSFHYFCLMSESANIRFKMNYYLIIFFTQEQLKKFQRLANFESLERDELTWRAIVHTKTRLDYNTLLF